MFPHTEQPEGHFPLVKITHRRDDPKATERGLVAFDALYMGYALVVAVPEELSLGVTAALEGSGPQIAEIHPRQIVSTLPNPN